MTEKKLNVLICGGTRGFGHILALNFTDEKYNVYILSRNQTRAFNIINCSMLNLTVSLLEKHLIDIVINNGFDKNDYMLSFESSINVLKVSFEYFKKKSKGVIVNVNSICGLIPDPRDPDYAAAKYGLRGYAESIASDAFKTGVRIINLYPRSLAIGMNSQRAQNEALIDPDELATFVKMLLETKTFHVGSVQIERYVGF